MIGTVHWEKIATLNPKPLTLAHTSTPSHWHTLALWWVKITSQSKQDNNRQNQIEIKIKSNPNQNNNHHHHHRTREVKRRWLGRAPAWVTQKPQPQFAFDRLQAGHSPQAESRDDGSAKGYSVDCDVPLWEDCFYIAVKLHDIYVRAMGVLSDGSDERAPTNKCIY
jgi:hypothetical protein